MTLSSTIALRIAGLLCGVSTVLSALELASLIFGWKWATRGPQLVRYAVVRHARRFAFYLPILTASGATLIIYPDDRIYLIVACVAASACWILLITKVYAGIEASDYANLAITAAIGLGATLSEDLAAIIITAFAVTVYLVGGLSKLVSPFWGYGGALFRIFDTGTYGKEHVRTFFWSRVRLLALAERVVTVGELAFPIMIFAPTVILEIFLLCWVLFHLTTAYAMGLNLFTFSFIATFPAILATHSLIYS